MRYANTKTFSRGQISQLTDDQLDAVFGGAFGKGTGTPGPAGGITTVRADVQRLVTDVRNHASLSTIRTDFAALRTHLRALLG
jgi:hypothetical protein